VRFPQAELGLQSTLETVYPVGAIFVSVVNTNPATLLGFGTWAAFGAGRCLVGVDVGDADFDAAEKTGGAKTVTLTADQSGVPAHGHGVTDPGHGHPQQIRNTGTAGTAGAQGSNTANNATAGTTSSATTGISVNNSTPANAAQAHSNVQPFIAVYLWKRTA
jgi:hypothetical protein